MNDDKKPYVMDDDARATIGRDTRSPVPPNRPRRDSAENKKPTKFDELLARVPTTWKALTLIAAIFVTGVAGHSYVVEYTKRYATKDDLANHIKHDTEMREQVRALREADATRAADISAIKADTAAVREDIRTLLQFMLNNPPARHAPDKARKP